MKQAEVKASQTKAKSDMLAKGWTQNVKQETPSPIVCAPMLWGSFGGAGEWPAAFGTPIFCHFRPLDPRGPRALFFGNFTLF